jgi:hypothetical protein
MRRLVNILAVIGAVSLIVGAGLLLRTLWKNREREYEARTFGNMSKVLIAADAYQIRDSAQYPANLWDTTSESESILFKHLPDGQLLVNPFTNARTEPRLGIPPKHAPPGSVWFEPIHDATGAITGYRIVGFGRWGPLSDTLGSGT